MPSGIEQGRPFVDIPVDELVATLAKEDGFWDKLWEKVELIAARALGVEEIVEVETVVECFAEHFLGRHLLEDCSAQDSIRLRHHIFQARRDG